MRPIPDVEGSGPSIGRCATSATAVIALQPASFACAQSGSSWRQSTSGRSALASRTISSRKALRPGGSVLPWKRFQVRTSRRSTVLPMRVALADPPAFTPAYDHALAAALARADIDVELVTSPFRFGEIPLPDGYVRSEPFYPLSSRLFRRSRLRVLGVDAIVIPHPVFPTDAPRADDGRTLLCLGTIRPYKGLGDAIAAARLIEGARLLVVGDPLEPLNGYRTQAGDVAEWRLGYLPLAEVEQALGEATVALFPYRPELDQSGALLQALGAGVPAIAYDVGGIAEPVRRFGAGRVVAPGDIGALASAIREVLSDPEPFRAGALRAREELT